MDPHLAATTSLAEKNRKRKKEKKGKMVKKEKYVIFRKSQKPPNELHASRQRLQPVLGFHLHANV